jgi:hypothetical protein
VLRRKFEKKGGEEEGLLLRVPSQMKKLRRWRAISVFYPSIFKWIQICWRFLRNETNEHTFISFRFFRSAMPSALISLNIGLLPVPSFRGTESARKVEERKKKKGGRGVGRVGEANKTFEPDISRSNKWSNLCLHALFVVYERCGADSLFLLHYFAMLEGRGLILPGLAGIMFVLEVSTSMYRGYRL